MAAQVPDREPSDKTPDPAGRQPIFTDEVDEFHVFIDHDTRGEPGYQPLPAVTIVPRVHMPPADSPDA